MTRKVSIVKAYVCLWLAWTSATSCKNTEKSIKAKAMPADGEGTDEVENDADDEAQSSDQDQAEPEPALEAMPLKVTKAMTVYRDYYVDKLKDGIKRDPEPLLPTIMAHGGVGVTLAESLAAASFQLQLVGQGAGDLTATLPSESGRYELRMYRDSGAGSAAPVAVAEFYVSGRP